MGFLLLYKISVIMKNYKNILGLNEDNLKDIIQIVNKSSSSISE